MPDDKAALARQRAVLVESLTKMPLTVQERFLVQGELSVINAKIKALNTTQAAQLKAAADQRRVAGLQEAQANAARTSARNDYKLSLNKVTIPSIIGYALEADENNGTGQTSENLRTAQIDAWIDAVLLRHDIDFTRDVTSKILLDVAPAYTGVLEALIAGIYAGARGHALPELPNTAPPSKAAPPSDKPPHKRIKPKKR